MIPAQNPFFTKAHIPLGVHISNTQTSIVQYLSAAVFIAYSSSEFLPCVIDLDIQPHRKLNFLWIFPLAE